METLLLVAEDDCARESVVPAAGEKGVETLVFPGVTAGGIAGDGEVATTKTDSDETGGESFFLLVARFFGTSFFFFEMTLILSTSSRSSSSLSGEGGGGVSKDANEESSSSSSSRIARREDFFLPTFVALAATALLVDVDRVVWN